MNYSIIIPHHNIPHLLRRLLDSIPIRQDTEVIIVDDNSSVDIVDFEHFPGIERPDVVTVFDKKGGYGGYARNLGLSVAKGKWLLFADADDYYNYCLNDILDEYINAEEDIVFFKANSVDSDFYTTSFRALYLNRWIDMSDESPKKAMLLLRYMFGEPWCKLIRREIVSDNNIQFEERSIHNDTAFSYLVGHYAYCVAVDKRAIYCVTSRDSSVSKDISESKKLERIENFGTSYMFFKRNNVGVHETRHFEQLFRSKYENEDTYNKGFKILVSLGLTESEIRKGLHAIKLKSIKKFLFLPFKKFLIRFLSRSRFGNYIIMEID